MHVVWGRGSTFPYRSAADLSDNVVGSARAPSPAACYTVAAVLGGAAALVVTPCRGRWHRRLLAAMATVIGVRAAFGFAGRTDRLVAGSNSAAFRRNDRRFFAPLCALLASGVATSARRA
jgi:hypothetical protein